MIKYFIPMLVLLLQGCSVSYIITQTHGTASDVVDETQKTDAQPQISLPNPLSAITA